MKLTNRGRTAVTAMVDVALRTGQGAVALLDVSRRQCISETCLETIFGALRRHDLVDSRRGPGGGYLLGRPAQEISVADIIWAVDGFSANPEAPLRQSREEDLANALWTAADRYEIEFLDSITLQSLVEHQLNLGVRVGTLERERAARRRRADIRIDAPNSIFDWATRA